MSDLEKFDSEKTAVEKEFEQVVALINIKLKEAAVAIKEASRLSNEFGMCGELIHTVSTDITDFKLDLNEEEEDPEDTIEVLFDMIDTSALEEALDMAGWNTSSSYC